MLPRDEEEGVKLQAGWNILNEQPRDRNRARVGQLQRYPFSRAFRLYRMPGASAAGELGHHGQRRPRLHQLLFPALTIGITMLAFNLFADGLRDALDPSTRA
jgi:hypothetical protein